MPVNSRIEGFRNMSPAARAEEVLARAGLDKEDLTLLTEAGALDVSTADGMIENVVGKFELPLGVATNFIINDKEYLIPMVVEEPSVVAAASYMAKLARSCGGFRASSTGPIMRAQIQILGVSDPHFTRLKIIENASSIISLANEQDKLLVSLGGGCREIEVHAFNTPRGQMIVVHLIVDVRDAMGANAVNTMAEAVAPYLEQITSGSARLRILSNFADKRLAMARVQISREALATQEFSGDQVVDGMLDAYALAAIDPYRATTHNKGIMNGIDPVILATGNDWRAVEAGAHAWASRGGRYTSLTTWEVNSKGDLVGTLEMPLAVGLIGGATKTHPLAQLAIKIMGVKTAQELAEVAVTVGLAQNMAAIRALATEGIQRGHMALHAKNIALLAGASATEVSKVVDAMISRNSIKADTAKTVLSELRGS